MLHCAPYYQSIDCVLPILGTIAEVTTEAASCMLYNYYKCVASHAGGGAVRTNTTLHYKAFVQRRRGDKIIPGHIHA